MSLILWACIALIVLAGVLPSPSEGKPKQQPSGANRSPVEHIAKWWWEL